MLVCTRGAGVWSDSDKLTAPWQAFDYLKPKVLIGPPTTLAPGNDVPMRLVAAGSDVSKQTAPARRDGAVSKRACENGTCNRHGGAGTFPESSSKRARAGSPTARSSVSAGNQPLLGQGGISNAARMDTRHPPDRPSSATGKRSWDSAQGASLAPAAPDKRSCVPPPQTSVQVGQGGISKARMGTQRPPDGQSDAAGKRPLDSAQGASVANAAGPDTRRSSPSPARSSAHPPPAAAQVTAAPAMARVDTAAQAPQHTVPPASKEPAMGGAGKQPLDTAPGATLAPAAGPDKRRSTPSAPSSDPPPPARVPVAAASAMAPVAGGGHAPPVAVPPASKEAGQAGAGQAGAPLPDLFEALGCLQGRPPDAPPVTVRPLQCVLDTCRSCALAREWNQLGTHAREKAQERIEMLLCKNYNLDTVEGAFLGHQSQRVPEAFQALVDDLVPRMAIYNCDVFRSTYPGDPSPSVSEMKCILVRSGVAQVVGGSDWPLTGVFSNASRTRKNRGEEFEHWKSPASRIFIPALGWTKSTITSVGRSGFFFSDSTLSFSRKHRLPLSLYLCPFFLDSTVFCSTCTTILTFEHFLIRL